MRKCRHELRRVRPLARVAGGFSREPVELADALQWARGRRHGRRAFALVGTDAEFFAAVAELAQIRELIMDRCKQISVEVEQLQSDAEYRHEEKLDAHLSKFQEWEENVAAGVRSRFEGMGNKWEMAQDDLDVFRMKLDDTLTRITADVNAKTEAVKVRQDGADRRMNGVDVEIEKLRARASQLEDAAVPHLNARVDEVHKQLEDFEVVVAQDFEAVRRAAGEHDALLSAHRSELDAHMKEIVAHGAAIGRAEGRLVEHDGTLRQHLATLENHGERVEALELRWAQKRAERGALREEAPPP